MVSENQNRHRSTFILLRDIFRVELEASSGRSERERATGGRERKLTSWLALNVVYTEERKTNLLW